MIVLISLISCAECLPDNIFLVVFGKDFTINTKYEYDYKIIVYEIDKKKKNFSLCSMKSSTLASMRN